MAELTVTFEKTIHKLLDEKKFSSVKDVLSTMAPSDVASILQDVDEKLIPVIFRLYQNRLQLMSSSRWTAIFRNS